jgi:hypothetical protein
MNKLLALAAVAEAATGLALLVVPSLVGRLLLGVALAGVAVPVARVAGVALCALGIACWPGKGPRQAALCAMTTYDLLVGLYFVYLGIRGEYAGPLLWPAALLHLILTALLARAWLKEQKQPSPNDPARA